MNAQALDISPGEHSHWHVFGITLNADTITGTVIAGLIVIGIGLLVRARSSVREPGRLQLAFETITQQVEDMVEDAMGVKTAPWAVPLGIALFLFILTANWLAVIPTHINEHHVEFVPPPASDVNLTYALAVIVIGTMHVSGIRRNGIRYYAHIFEKPRFLFPLRIIEEIVRPVTLSLRLFGNIFAGTIMVTLIAALPVYVLWAPNIIWKLFDMFIGLIQAFIFALLTVLYLSSIKPHEAHTSHTQGVREDHGN